MINVLPLIGLAGLHEDENQRAQLCYRILEWPMIAAAIWLVAVWYQGMVDKDFSAGSHLELGLWYMFVLETSLLTLLVDNRRRYLKENWINVVIIIIGLPLLFGFESYGGALRILRVLILIDISMHMSSSLLNMLSRNALAPTFLGSAIVVVMAGFMIAGIDPAISSPSEGIWWAWVTISTVGYGDIVPSTNVGRVFGGVLILIGLGLISMLTASIAAVSIERSGKKQNARFDRKERKRIALLEHQLVRIEEKLDELLSKDRDR